MAEAKLSMSLDDIIKQNEKKRESKPVSSIRSKAAHDRGNATNVRVVPRPRGITKRAPTKLVTISYVSRQDKRGAGGPRHPATVRHDAASTLAGPERIDALLQRKHIPGNGAPIQQAQVPRGNPESRWRHDLYAEGSRPTRSAPRAEGTKLLISNLDFEVSDQDMKELFAPFGSLKQANITYDRSGRSEGIAEVIFANRADAIRAKEKYHNMLLDGKKMVIVVEETSSDVFSRLTNMPKRSRTRATGRMRGYEDDEDDVMEE